VSRPLYPRVIELPVHEVYQSGDDAESRIYCGLVSSLDECPGACRVNFPECCLRNWLRVTTGSMIANSVAMKRVLLVEDSDDVLCLLQMELEWRGYRVDAAPNARAALTALERARPDVIVSDLGMPEMDGFELIRRIRANPALSSVPAIALTGAVMDKDVQQAIALGFTAHIAKPVEADELESRIEQLTARGLDLKAG
jgi:CheY-like chemotaxis protein